MTSTTRGQPGWCRPGPRKAAALLGSAALLAGTAVLPAAQAASAATSAAPPYSCAPNGPTGNQTVYGTFGDASVLGWTGNHQGVPACLGGSFFVISHGQPGNGTTTTPVTGTTYGATAHRFPFPPVIWDGATWSPTESPNIFCGP